MKYVIDIDGTICTQSGTDYESAEPKLERISQLNSLFDEWDDMTETFIVPTSNFMSLPEIS